MHFLKVEYLDLNFYEFAKKWLMPRFWCPANLCCLGLCSFLVTVFVDVSRPLAQAFVAWTADHALVLNLVLLAHCFCLHGGFGLFACWWGIRNLWTSSSFDGRHWCSDLGLFGIQVRASMHSATLSFFCCCLSARMEFAQGSAWLWLLLVPCCW